MADSDSDPEHEKMEKDEDVEEEDEMDQDEDDSEDDEDEKQDRMIAELQKSISKNAYNYDVHIQLIELLKKMGELIKLRDAREQMSKLFPLTEDLWLSWLRDEIKLVSSDAERKRVNQLFERAVKDYLAVEVWLEWVQFSIGGMGGDGGLEMVRSVFERALTAVGLHVSKGAVLWEAFREFEGVILSTFEPQPGSVPSNEQMDKQRAQRERIQGLFKRQLAVPLLDMEATREELRDWAIADEESIALYGYERALNKLKQIVPFEENLLKKTGDDLIAEYRAYIQHEKGDPARVQILYERAVTQFALNADLWLEYVKFVETTLRIQEISLSVIERALRNVPWDGRLWIANLRAGERFNRDHLQMQSCLETALVSGLSTAEDYRTVWEAYLDYLRRRVPWDEQDQKELIKTRIEEMRLCSTRACEHLAEMFGPQGDYQCSILRIWARCEAARCGNLEKFRQLWTDIMTFEQMGHSATYWLEYISVERACGDEKHLRKLFGRALNSTRDWPEGIAEAWTSYEREQGCLDSFEFCLEKIEERMERLKIQRAREQEKQDVKSQKDNRLKRKRDSKDNKGGKFMKSDRPEPKKPEFKAPFPVMDSNPKPVAKPKVAPPPGYKPDRDGPEKKKAVVATEANKPGEHDSSKDNRSVFVSNLSYDATDEEIKEVLGPNAVEVKLVKDFKGRSKGFGYVEMQSVEDALDALSKDRQPVRNRPMFVSRCDSDKDTRRKQFKFSQGIENNKLFIKGLSFDTTKETLEQFFGQYGIVKDVRIVTYRNGHSKGLAYVDFEDDSSAAQAVLKTDNFELDGKTISVAISRPPEKNKTSLIDIPSLGGRPRDPTAPRPQRGVLMPRAVRLALPSAEASQTNGASSSATKKNNDEFRAMFLGNK